MPMSVFSEDGFIRRHKIVSGVLLLLILLALWIISLRWGPCDSYTVDLLSPAGGKPAEAPGRIMVGVAKREITADLAEYDGWTDGNNNNKYDLLTDAGTGWQKALFRVVNHYGKFIDLEKARKSGDSYVDRNHNGKFDPVWVAGFGADRPAKGVHDPQWVRAIAVRNNGVTVVMLSVDAIGIFHNDVAALRKSINPALKVDHVVLSSTHCHEVPDTMGNWSGLPMFGYDIRYITKIKRMAKEAVEEAVAALQPADMYCATAKVPGEGFVRDSRKPDVLDPDMCLWRFTRPDSPDQTIATFVNWGNHPESLGGDNPLLSSDFAHYLREGLEKGVPEPNGVEGFGGTCVYFQGMVGGLATQLGVTVPNRDGSGGFREDSFEKAEHLGYNAAILAANTLRGPEVWKNENPLVAVAARTIKVKMDNPLFKYGIMLGLLHQGYYWGGYAKSEVDAIRIGDVVIVTVPGELYSEIAVGGVEARPGRDFNIAPVEVPPFQNTQLQFARQAPIFGLCNDEVGYIIPKSQWDAEAPWTYGDSDQYGEENSGGPEAAPAVHRAALEMIGRINKTFAK